MLCITECSFLITPESTVYSPGLGFCFIILKAVAVDTCKIVKMRFYLYLLHNASLPCLNYKTKRNISMIFLLVLYDRECYAFSRIGSDAVYRVIRK
jgi:hypothetical protein